MAIIAARLLPAVLLLWAPSSGEAPSSLGTEVTPTGPAEGGGLVYPLYVYPSQASLAGIYTVSPPPTAQPTELSWCSTCSGSYL